MIKEVVKTTIAKVFSINDNKVYTIPKYQREYTWGVSEWDALFNDVTENEKGYFLGSYICVCKNSINVPTLEVIDGQQRFTTISILLAALYEKLSKFINIREIRDPSELNNLGMWMDLKGMLAQTDQDTMIENSTPRLLLQKQNLNDDDYLYILSSAKIITQSFTKPANFGNRRIAKAYRHFQKLIDDEVVEIKSIKENITDVAALFEIVKKFKEAILVGIEVDTNKDAYMLFESLNHRGVPLSALDLIKNTLIAKAEETGDAENAYAQWKQILSAIGNDDYAVQERFFRQYYNAFRDELNAPYPVCDKKYFLGYLATRTTLLGIYEKLLKESARENSLALVLNDLTEKAKHYSVIVNNSEEQYPYSKSMLALERIAGATSYLLLLYLLSNQQSLGLGNDDIDQIVKVLITFFVRRNLTDVPNTRKLTQLFIDIIGSVKTQRGSIIVEIVKEKLKQISASDDMFLEKLRGPIYDENPDVTRFVLCEIETLRQTKEIFTDLWSRDNSGKYIWTIEHIFPEGENIPKSWVDMIANGDVNMAKEYRVKYVHTLGNLTVTGYNQNLSNKSFEEKRDRTSKDGTKLIGYRNKLFLNEDVELQEKWTIEDIKKRTEKLVTMLLKMYAW